MAHLIHSTEVNTQNQRRKRGRLSRAELAQRQAHRLFVDKSNRQIEADFAVRLRGQMHRYGLQQVTRDRACILMQEIHDPQWWIFSSRDCVGGLLDALVEHHGWDYQPKQFTYEETQQDPTYSKMTFWEWRYTKITYIAPQL